MGSGLHLTYECRGLSCHLDAVRPFKPDPRLRPKPGLPRTETGNEARHGFAVDVVSGPETPRELRLLHEPDVDEIHRQKERGPCRVRRPRAGSGPRRSRRRARPRSSGCARTGTGRSRRAVSVDPTARACRGRRWQSATTTKRTARRQGAASATPVICSSNRRERSCRRAARRGTAARSTTARARSRSPEESRWRPGGGAGQKRFTLNRDHFTHPAPRPLPPAP